MPFCESACENLKVMNSIAEWSASGIEHIEHIDRLALRELNFNEHLEALNAALD